MIARPEFLDQPWEPVSTPALIGWAAFYLLFMWHAATTPVIGTWIDGANFVMHEAGHLLFSYLGEKTAIAGGTIFQFAVPLMIAAAFLVRRNAPGVAFGMFFFFENFLYSAPYIADARAQELPLLSVGGGEADHDWYMMLSWLGLLERDHQFARVARISGWLGMMATLGWYVWRGWRSRTEQEA